MKKKPDLLILFRMTKELGALTPIIFITILLGVGGYLSASSIAITSAFAGMSFFDLKTTLPISSAITILIISAIARGFLRYAEQLSGHYIAFRILAMLRDKVFNKLKELAPAKLDTKDKGSIISVLTSDIEMMEVFYAHTIAPIAIAIITSVIYASILWNIHYLFGLFSITLYILIGIIIPIIFKNLSSSSAHNYRHNLGRNNSFILDTMRGLKEILQFGAGANKKDQMSKRSKTLEKDAMKVKKYQAIGFAVTDLMILLSLLGLIAIGFALKARGILNSTQVIISAVILISSFGPVVAISALSTTLSGTLAAARSVFKILDEAPETKDIFGKKQVGNYDINCEDISFSYPSRDVEVLKNVALNLDQNEHVAIMGQSGSGKSTILKLIMRFYDAQKGNLSIGKDEIKTIPTKSLRTSQTMFSQSSFLFNDTIENNIRMGNLDISIDDIVEASKKASIHDSIIKLPQKYQTNAGELGQRFSSGEKQRIALARSFAAKGKILILDEPTSNVDVLSEAVILKSIKENCKKQSVLLVTHRASTASICNRKLLIENGSIAQSQPARK